MSSATGDCVSLVRLAKVRCVLRISLDGGPGFFGPRYQHQGPSKPRGNVARVVVPVDEVEQTIRRCPEHAAIFFSSEEKFYTIKP